MDKKDFLLSLTNFDSTFRRYDELKKNRFVPAIKDVQNFLRQISVYQYLLFYTNNNYKSEELIDILNQIRQPSAPPAAIYNTFRWATNKVSVLITSLREQFATALVKFAKKYEENYHSELFDYFSIITFPSIFGHFADEEFERLGYIFIKILMKTLPSSQYEKLIYSFLLESGEFQSCLWNLFDEYASQTVTQNTSAQYFFPLLSALSQASSLLSFHQVKLLLKYKEKDPQAFISFFVTTFLLNSYNIYHSSRIKLQNQANPIQDLSDYLSAISKSPHIDMIFSILHHIKKFRKQPPHAMFIGIGDFPIYLSIKDIYIIQLIMKISPDDSMKIPDAFLISEEMTKKSICVQITTLLFINKEDYKYLHYKEKSSDSIKNKAKYESLKNKNYFKDMVNVDEMQIDSKNDKFEELNERMKLIATQNGFSGSMALIKSDRQGPPIARKQKEKLTKSFDSNTIKYIEDINLSKNASKLKNVDLLFVTDLYYFDEIQKLLAKITKHLTCVLYFLLGSLYQSDRPSVDPLLTTSLEMRQLQSAMVIQAEIQSWAVLRHKDCFNSVDYTDSSDFIHSNIFQTLNGKLSRPLAIAQKKKPPSEKQFKSDVPNATDLFNSSSYGSKSLLYKKRRNSFDATKSVSSSFQLELIKKLGLVNKKDKFLMFVIFVRMFDQSNLEDSQVPKLRKLYIQFMNTERIRKLGKPNSLTFKEEKKLKKKKSKKDKNNNLKSKFSDFEDCFTMIAKMIDDLAKIRKASCILKLAEISCRIQEVASSYVSYLNSTSSSNSSSNFVSSDSSSMYSSAYMLSSITSSARQYAGNNEDENSNVELLHKVAYLIFKHCLLLSVTDAFYVAFIWEQKLMTIFPILKQHANIPHLNLAALEFIESSFYNYLKKDPDLLEKTQEIRRFLFK